MGRDTISIYFLQMLSFDLKGTPPPRNGGSVIYSVEIVYIIFHSGRFVVYLSMKIFEKSYIEEICIDSFPHLIYIGFFFFYKNALTNTTNPLNLPCAVNGTVSFKCFALQPPCVQPSPVLQWWAMRGRSPQGLFTSKTNKQASKPHFIFLSLPVIVWILNILQRFIW